MITTRKTAALIGAMRRDGYENTLSGLAGTRNNANKFVAAPKLGEPELKTLYDNNWLARRGVDAIVDQALRKPLIGEKDAFKPFEKVNNDPRFPGGALRHGLKLGRLCGGAAIVQGVVGSGAPLEKPLPLDKDGIPVAGELAFLEVVTRFDLESASKYDTKDDPTKHRRTEVWKVKSGRLKDLKIHESRLIFCGGLAKVGLNDEQDDRDWPWISVLQPVNEILGSYGITWTSIAHLIQESSIAWLRLRGLTEMLTTEDKAAVDERMTLLSTGRNVAKTVFLEAGTDGDSGEEYGRTDVAFTGLPDLLRECTLTVCGGFRVPYIILMGDTPAGLNATGDSTLQQWYDTSEEYRREVEPALRTLFAGTKVTADWSWPPLWEPTAAEAADIRAKELAGDQTLYTMSVIEPEHVLESRSKDGTLGLPGVDWSGVLRERLAAKEGVKVELTPTDNAKALTFNELRANQGKGPICFPGTTTPDPDGDLPSALYEFKKTEEIKAALASAAGEDEPDAEGEEDTEGPSPRADWNENQPRDEQGQFSFTEGGGAADVGRQVLGRALDAKSASSLTGHSGGAFKGAKREISLNRSQTKDGRVALHASVVYKKDGKIAAQIERKYSRNEKGDLVAEHGVIEVDESFRGQGEGAKAVANQLASYKKEGVKEVTLDAEMDGPYVWAKAGFVVADESAMSSMRERFLKFAETQGASEKTLAALGKIKTARAISLATFEGEKIGKDFLRDYHSEFGESVPMRLEAKDFDRAIRLLTKKVHNDALSDGFRIFARSNDAAVEDVLTREDA